jgi:hypothetical protein
MDVNNHSRLKSNTFYISVPPYVTIRYNHPNAFFSAYHSNKI